MTTTQLDFLGAYSTGVFAESAAETIAFDPLSGLVFVSNAATFSIDVLDISNPTQPTLVNTIDLSSLGGGVNSVTVNNGTLAIAIEATVKQEPGRVAFFNTDGSFINSVTVGALPDALKFTPDGSKVIVANEGEPSDDYSTDPNGSISVIDISNGIGNLSQNQVSTVSFSGLDKQALIDAGVRIFGPNASVAQDLEPENIAISADSKTAWITLQENNALAKVNLTTGQVEVLPLGFIDRSVQGNGLDASDKDGAIDIQSYDNLFGIYQPDAIAAYESGGQTFLITANEGDARDYDGFSEEARVADLVLDPIAFPNAADLQKDENLGRLKVTTTLGDTDGDGDYDELYSYGGRSFSIWDSNANLIFDSGEEFERIVASQIPNDFNSDDEENGSFKNRSDDKGPEPQAVVVGKVDGKTLAFIGLERVGGVMVYDVTNPSNPKFRQYINRRDFNVPVTLPDGSTNPAVGDLGIEGLAFIASADSPTGRPLLAVTGEVSGTTAFFDVGKQIKGGGGRDKLKGTQGADLIRGRGGNDKLEGDGGNDTLFGDAGNDEIKAKRGNSRLFGGAGNDKLEAKEGNNLLDGGDGRDKLKAEKGNNRLFGRAGNDELEAKDGNNLLYGGDGNDELKAEKGNNQLFGGDGNDSLETKEGNNLLVGGAGNDRLKVEKGNDTLIGVDPDAQFAGRGEIDELIGGGRARYVLGDTAQVYYDDGNTHTYGFFDHAYIDEFDGKNGDVIQLKGDASEYYLGNGRFKNEKALFFTQGGQSELIALVNGKNLTSLSGASFDYV